MSNYFCCNNRDLCLYFFGKEKNFIRFLSIILIMRGKKMNVHNIMEEYVTQCVNGFYDSLKEQNTPWLSCDCESCRLDACSFVLNRIPPRYIVSGRGVTHFDADVFFSQIQADINRLAMEGIRLVSSAKRSYHNQLKPPSTTIVSEMPMFNFPIFSGQVFDGAMFAPLSGATVVLKQGENLAEMHDMTWMNPSPTFAATSGHYTFWVAAQQASFEGETKTFQFTIEVSAEGYESTTYVFEVPLVAEKLDRSALNKAYSLKIQDLFLFTPDYEDTVISSMK